MAQEWLAMVQLRAGMVQRWLVSFGPTVDSYDPAMASIDPAVASNGPTVAN